MSGWARDSCSTIAQPPAFGTLCGLVLAVGRNPRARALDLMIAATAYANEAGVYTRNPGDFAGVEPLVAVLTP